MTSHLPWMKAELITRERESLRRARREVTPLPGGRCLINGRELVNFSTNDYLDLAGDERLAGAARKAIEDSGTGARSSALISGRTPWHAALERRIANFEGTESTVLFPSGYAANLGTIAALVSPEDVVFCDRFNHASLVDGIRLSGAKLRVYRHGRLEKLERELQKQPGDGHRWIVTDAVFSMDGDLAPLPDLCELAERFDAALVVDEAHGTGVFGVNGRGASELLGVEHRVAVRVGTLSKAVGSLGGFVAGTRTLTDWLWNTARPQMFSTALPPSVCAAAATGLEVIQQEPERRRRLHQLSDRLRAALTAAGVETVPGNVGPIVPVIVGDSEHTMQVARELECDGFLVGSIRPPTVPLETARLRITLSIVHSESDVDELAAAVGSAMKNCDP